ncbi:MAG: SDR family NAD(P)-dependent oxidoreductase [Saprospiraceae bacterium]
MARGIQVKEPKEDALTVLVTGATSGIGLAIAEAFAADGHKVIMTGRRAERLRAMQFQFMKRYGVSPQVLAFDVRNREELAAQFATLPEGWRDIDVLVNNAGLAKGFAPIHEGSYEHWETMIDTNIKGLLYMTRLISPLMVERQSGHIINISSSAGKEVYPNGNVYCATKFAVEALTKGMRLDLHQHGIRVSSVSPGHVETEFALVRFDGNADKAKIYDDFQPLTAKDVADAVVYAATRPAHVNVENIHIFATQQASSTTLNRSGRKN